MPSALTREEELAIWLEKKKKKKKQVERERKSLASSTRKSLASRSSSSVDRPTPKTHTSSLPPLSAHKPQTTVSSVRPIMIKVGKENERRFSSTSSWKNSVNATTPSSSRKNSVNIATPSSAEHLQRARNVLKERNYNKKNGLTGPRKRSLSDRSPTVNKDPSKPFLITKRKPSSAKRKDCVVGISIVVSATRPSLSPISIATLSTPKPQELPSLEENIVRKEVFSPPAEKQQQKKESPTERNDNSITKKPAFSFEEDEDDSPLAKFYEERRRRPDAGFLLLPSPSSHLYSSETSPQNHSNASRGNEYPNLSNLNCNKNEKEASTTPMGSESPLNTNITVKSDLTEPSPRCSTKKVTFLNSELISEENACGDLSQPLVDSNHGDVISGNSILSNDNEIAKPNLNAETNLKPPNSGKETFCFSDLGDKFTGFCLEERVKVKDRTVLEPALEKPNDEKEDREMNLLKKTLKTTMEEKQVLMDRLSNIRKSYEQRVTPFRDVFEENRVLRTEKKELKFIVDKTNAQNEQLRSQKKEVETMITKLEKETMANLMAVVQNCNQLKRDLQDAHARIRYLEQQAANVDESLDVTVS